MDMTIFGIILVIFLVSKANCSPSVQNVSPSSSAGLAPARRSSSVPMPPAKPSDARKPRNPSMSSIPSIPSMNSGSRSKTGASSRTSTAPTSTRVSSPTPSLTPMPPTKPMGDEDDEYAQMFLQVSKALEEVLSEINFIAKSDGFNKVVGAQRARNQADYVDTVMLLNICQALLLDIENGLIRLKANGENVQVQLKRWVMKAQFSNLKINLEMLQHNRNLFNENVTKKSSARRAESWYSNILDSLKSIAKNIKKIDIDTKELDLCAIHYWLEEP